MRPRSRLPRMLAMLAAASTALVGLSAAPSLAAPNPAPTPKAQHSAPGLLPPTGAATGATTDPGAPQHARLSAAQLPPHSPISAPNTKTSTRAAARAATAGTASCTAADFSSRTGSALVSFVKGSTTDCVNTLFGVTGGNASGVFKQSQMLTVANALHSSAASYSGDNSTGIWQLVLFLRAGYYVQYNDPTDVGSYDATLTNAVSGALDTLFAAPHFTDVSDANGQVAGEAIVLSDSANLQARYLNTYKQVLNGYTSADNSLWYMRNFVNDVFTPIYRGHQNADYVNAVTADPSLIDTLDAFALNHKDLLGTDSSFLDSNAGIETSRFVEHPALQAKVRPLIKGLLNASAITGPTAPLWVGAANLAAAEDQAQCSYYGVCNLPQQLTAAALPISHSCDSTHTIRAQDLTAADLDAVCASLQGQDPFFHGLVKDNGPIPGEYESTLQLVVFASSTDYQTYAGPIYGISTNNGGMTLSGDPANPANQPLSITYRWATDNGFTARIWNLNHEYTHALDARFDTKGDFGQAISVPDVWWIEGVAEYVSYTYRNVTDTQAMTEAAKHTYPLSTLFQNTYENSDTIRTYPWGYLAVRYMVERHPADVQAMLSHFRTGDYAGGYAVYNSVGTAYDADFNTWLDACAAGACTAGSTPPPAPACTAADQRAMDKDCSRGNQSETAGNIDYFYLYLPAGTTTLDISSSGGTGTAYLLYNPNSWATPNAYTSGSLNNGTTQSLTVTNTTAGYRYFSLYAQTDFSGVTVTTRY